MQKRVAATMSGGLVAAAQMAGARFNPGPQHPRTAAWYASLEKPGFTPPAPAFAIAWTALDALQAYSGTRLLAAPSSRARKVALGLWAVNVLGVAGFSWVLFGRRRLDQAAGVSATMLVSAAGTVAAASMVDKRAAWAGLPLALWVGFATLLQEEVWRRNR